MKSKPRELLRLPEDCFPCPFKDCESWSTSRDEMGFYSSFSVLSTSTAVSFLKNIEPDTVINPRRASNSPPFNILSGFKPSFVA